MVGLEYCSKKKKERYLTGNDMSSGDNSTSATLTNMFGGDPDSGSNGIDVDVVKGLTIIGIVVAVLFTLILLRFGCNICIDLIILRDFDAFMRSISKARRIVLPWFHPRTQPQHGRGDDHDEEYGNVDGGVTELATIDMDQVLAGLSPQQKQSLVEQVLTTKVRVKRTCLDTSRLLHCSLVKLFEYMFMKLFNVEYHRISNCLIAFFALPRFF